jgi:hypothetical protein
MARRQWNDTRKQRKQHSHSRQTHAMSVEKFIRGARKGQYRTWNPAYWSVWMTPHGQLIVVWSHDVLEQGRHYLPLQWGWLRLLVFHQGRREVGVEQNPTISTTGAQVQALKRLGQLWGPVGPEVTARTIRFWNQPPTPKVQAKFDSVDQPAFLAPMHRAPDMDRTCMHGTPLREHCAVCLQHVWDVSRKTEAQIGQS